MKTSKPHRRLLARTLDTHIDIDASPANVWAALVDFAKWNDWNAFIPHAEGTLAVGSTMQITVVPPGLKPMVFKPEVYIVKEPEEILWGGSFLRVIYRGDHRFLLEELPGGRTRFRQIERFRGPMVLFMGSMIRKTEIGYHQMNQAFKAYVESTH
jgi:hypothetical protein